MREFHLLDRIAAWGNNSQGQTSVPLDLSNAVAIAAGNEHALAIRSDGTVAAWGETFNGQTTLPAGLTNIVSTRPVIITAWPLDQMELSLLGATMATAPLTESVVKPMFLHLCLSLS